jgi:hypothetical protein
MAQSPEAQSKVAKSEQQLLDSALRVRAIEAFDSGLSFSCFISKLYLPQNRSKMRTAGFAALRLRDGYHPLFFADAYSVPTNMGVWRRRCVRLARHGCPKCLSCLSESECGAVNGEDAR